jgi:hypothetical protein
VNKEIKFQFKTQPQGDDTTQVVSNPSLLKYDSTQVYTQMGLAIKMADTCRQAFYRLLQLNRGTIDEQDYIVNGFLDRIQKLIVDMDEVERFVFRMKSTSEHNKEVLATNAFEAGRVTLEWFKAFVQSHNAEDRESLSSMIPNFEMHLALLEQFKKIKVDAAVQMEEAFTQVRSDIRTGLSKKKRRGTPTSGAFDLNQALGPVVENTPRLPEEYAATGFDKLIASVKEDIKRRD